MTRGRGTVVTGYGRIRQGTEDGETELSGFARFSNPGVVIIVYECETSLRDRVNWDDSRSYGDGYTLG